MAPNNKKLLELLWLYFTWKLLLDCHPSINVDLKGNHMVKVFVLLVTWVLLSQFVPPLFFQTCQRKLGWQKKYIIKWNWWMLFNYFMEQITTNDDSYLFVCLFVFHCADMLSFLIRPVDSNWITLVSGCLCWEASCSHHGKEATAGQVSLWNGRCNLFCLM